MDSHPDPRPDLTAAQRIAIALGTADDPHTAESVDVRDDTDSPEDAPADSPA